MAWIIRIDGHEVDSDDFLLDDLAWIEKTTGSFWSILNPWKSATQAKAFIRVALVRSGVSEEEADERVESLTLKDTKSAFDFREEKTAAPGGQQGKGRKGQTSPSTSRGGRRGSTGRPAKSEGSE